MNVCDASFPFLDFQKNLEKKITNLDIILKDLKISLEYGQNEPAVFHLRHGKYMVIMSKKV